jgi:hypothetical protein
MQQVLLRNLGAEAGEGAENLQPAAHHYKERNCIQPMAQPHYIRMFVNCPRHDDGLIIPIVFILASCLYDFDDCIDHLYLQRADTKRYNP